MKPVRWSLVVVAAAMTSASLPACSDAGAPDASTSEADLLPNGGVYERDHDGQGYRVIAEYFGSRGYDLHVDTSRFAPRWPLATTTTSVLNRVGTPIFLGGWNGMGYYHTGFDVLRGPAADGTVVRAPHDGLALVFDWFGNRTNPANAYSSVVAIYDPVSHVVTQLMHCRASAQLAVATEPVAIRAGDVIGEIAPSPFVGPDAERLRHTHVDFIDGENKRILPPAKLFAGYHDAIAPEQKRVYVADERAVTGDALVSGKLDVVVEAFDRDDDSGRNLEINALAFTIEDGTGRRLAELPRCELDDVYASVAAPSSFRAAQLVDFGSARPQLGGGWPSSDIDNAARTFRYALTQLAVVDGRCRVLDDVQGGLDVRDDVTSIVVKTRLWDPRGNASDHVATLTRRP